MMQEPSQIAQAGEAIYRAVISPIYHNRLDWIGPTSLGLAAGMAGVMLWRSLSTRGKRLALTSPRLYTTLHGPLWTPAVLGIGGLGAAIWSPLASAQNLHARAWSLPFAWSNETILQTIVGGAALVAVGAVVALRRLTREKVHMGQHGTAYWAARRDMRVAPDTAKKQGWVWTLPIRVHWRGTARDWSSGGACTVLTISREEVVRHILLVGATGSGKGFTYFSPIIASIKQPFILQDIKSECQGIDTLRALTGMDPIRWGCAARGGWPSMRWNPLHAARTDEIPEEGCASLAALLCPTEGNQNDFIQKLAADTLTFIFQFSPAQTLADVADQIEQEGLIPLVERLGALPGLLARLNGKNMDGWTTDAIKGALSPYCTGWGREVTSGHDFDLDDLFLRGGYVLSGEPIASKAAPIRMFWQMLLNRALTSNAARNLTMLMDEGLIVKVPKFTDALKTLRSKGVSIHFGIQNTQGVLALYGPQEGKDILDSFVTQVYLLNGLNPDDQRALSQALGKRTVIEKGQAGVGKARRRAQVGTDLLEIADIERRSKSGEAWAVIRAPKVTRAGVPIICKLTGSAGAGLVRHPSPDEVEAARAAILAMPQPAPYIPPKPPAPKTFEVPTEAQTTQEAEETLKPAAIAADETVDVDFPDPPEDY